MKRNRPVSGKVDNIIDPASEAATHDGENCVQENLHQDTKEAKIANSGLKTVVERGAKFKTLF